MPSMTEETYMCSHTKMSVHWLIWWYLFVVICSLCLRGSVGVLALRLIWWQHQCGTSKTVVGHGWYVIIIPFQLIYRLYFCCHIFQ